ncbi:PREDICTED: phorbol-12-myristate-13-acetate-induced protein 1 [Myotis davidii]|uniref:phorbol-12-myristate-13-acetate-induced protein 1 n=1 Tax=Myotis davidii TaxID=225400 RepID=UPI0007678D1A|nr:PREDICTED: phorbol-12-myristate-13-acetate-induced protein 1 [Myotis davidii]
MQRKWCIGDVAMSQCVCIHCVTVCVPSHVQNTGVHKTNKAEIECALQLRRIGDKLSFLQKLLNLMYKLFGSGT